MTYTTGATIIIHKVLRAGSDVLVGSTLTIHAEVTYGGTKTLYTTGVTILQATSSVDGYVKITVPLGLGTNKVKLFNSVSDVLDTDGNTTEQLGSIAISRVESVVEVEI